MVVLNVQNVCLLLCVLSSRGQSSDLIDYKRALDILIDNPKQNLARSLSVEFEFVSFMRDYGRVYKGRDELYRRLDYFKASLERIDEVQAADKGTAKYGVTRFSDHSDDELKALTGLRLNQPLSVDTAKLLRREEAKDLQYGRGDRSPASFDWRMHGAVTSVKNQFKCGACWAFSAIGAVEAHHAIRTRELVELSVQQLIDCDDRDDGCAGGFMHEAFQYIMDAGGVVPSSDYEYSARRSSEESQQCDVTEADQDTVVRVVGFANITGEHAMKRYLYEHGPISVAVNAEHLVSYTSGIVDLDEWSCDPEYINHGVLLVGYGEEESSGDKIPYWIIKNSWSSTWGEKGYFRIRRGRNVCGVAMLATGVETD